MSISYPLLFTSGVHDIKNHLNALLMALNTAYASADLTKLPELSARCVEMASRLDQMLVLRRSEDGGLEVLPDTFELGDLIEDCLLECQPIFDSRMVKAKLAGEVPDCLWVRADKTLFSMILNNLFYNASVWAKSTVLIDITLDVDKTVHIAVCDDGPGFPKELQNLSLSTMLQQGENRSLLQLLGTGLYLCAYSAHLMQSAGIICDMTLTNRPRSGATVCIDLKGQRL